MATENDVTRRLSELREGSSEAFDQLFPLVYEPLRRIARAQLSGAGSGRTLSPTVLVHEAYLRLVDQTRADWRDRQHFYAVAARAMRQITVDHARARLAKKRGGGEVPLALDEGRLGIAARAEALLDLDEALEELAATAPRLARVVEMRYFAGLGVEETAELCGVTPRTVKRDWSAARALLHRRLGRGSRGDAEEP
jgi:RNA polymerase sigma factor (TIGR02999 family)